MEIKLFYFKIPFWRAEVTRLALFIGDIPFKDYRVGDKEIDNLKKTGLLPNNQIAPFTVLIILPAILYGSPFEAGLLSSSQPL